MTEGLTITQETEGNELLISHVDNPCGKQSALVRKGNDGRHSLLSGSMAEEPENSSRKVVVRVHERWS